MTMRMMRTERTMTVTTTKRTKKPYFERLWEPLPVPLDLPGSLASRRGRVEHALAHGLPRQVPERLAKAMRYSLLAGGKRLRPLLLLASAEACGEKTQRLL